MGAPHFGTLLPPVPPAPPRHICKPHHRKDGEDGNGGGWPILWRVAVGRLTGCRAYLSQYTSGSFAGGVWRTAQSWSRAIISVSASVAAS